MGINQEKYTDSLNLIDQYLKKNPDHKDLLCNQKEIREKMGHSAIANAIKEKLDEKYPDNYKCGFFKNTTPYGDIAGKPF